LKAFLHYPTLENGKLIAYLLQYLSERLRPTNEMENKESSQQRKKRSVAMRG
jgi:hypothetical protein